jgi:hypothetical protein
MRLPLGLALEGGRIVGGRSVMRTTRRAGRLTSVAQNWRCGSARPVGRRRQDEDAEHAVSPPLGDTERGLVGEEFGTSGPEEARAGAGRGAMRCPQSGWGAQPPGDIERWWPQRVVHRCLRPQARVGTTLPRCRNLDREGRSSMLPERSTRFAARYTCRSAATGGPRPSRCSTSREQLVAIRLADLRIPTTEGASCMQSSYGSGSLRKGLLWPPCEMRLCLRSRRLQASLRGTGRARTMPDSP